LTGIIEALGRYRMVADARQEDCISFIVGKAAQQVARRAREKLEPHDVTPTQYAVLKVLSDADGQTGAELGARLGIDSATTTGVADRLAANGLLERRPDPQDRRFQRLFLTPEARALQPILDHEMDQLNREVEGELDADAPRLRSRLRQLGARKA
jgi:MarR family transcriptional regulator, organic hydroperoxide resistance regulator